MPLSRLKLAAKAAMSMTLLAMVLPGCVKEKPVSATSDAASGDPASTVAASLATTSPASVVVDGPARPLGFQPRHGDEIVVAGKYYRIGAPVVLWTDPGGYDAYRTERRFSDYDESSYRATTRASADNADADPARYGLRYGRATTQKYTPQELEQIRGGGWSLPLLQKVVDQFVLHYDVAGVSRTCFLVLHDRRFLSVQFMLDVDGTIYQTLDLKERAFHATKSNDRSIGIEIANMGAYGGNETPAPLIRWYEKQPDGRMMMTIPDNVAGSVRTPGPFYSRRNELVVGKIHGSTYRQYDLTPQQYDSLIKLTAGLCDIFPLMRPDAPRGADGKVTTTNLTDEEWTNFKGILGHYHVQRNKQDPGPAFDWDYFLPAVNKQLQAIRATRGTVD